MNGLKPRCGNTCSNYGSENDIFGFCQKYMTNVVKGSTCLDFEEHFTPVNTEDQQAKKDAGKAKLSLVPRRIIWDIATIREYGNNKYPIGGPDNWRQVDVSRYRDAAYRHFLLYLDDPNSVDEESGLPHLWHLACNVAFLCEMEDIT